MPSFATFGKAVSVAEAYEDRPMRITTVELEPWQVRDAATHWLKLAKHRSELWRLSHLYSEEKYLAAMDSGPLKPKVKRTLAATGGHRRRGRHTGRRYHHRTLADGRGGWLYDLKATIQHVQSDPASHPTDHPCRP